MQKQINFYIIEQVIQYNAKSKLKAQSLSFKSINLNQHFVQKCVKKIN